MVAEPRTPHSALLEARLAGRDVAAPGRGLAARLTSAPALAAMLLAVILLAIGPLQELDLFLARRWLYRWEPSLLPFAQNVLDRLASQIVCVPILAALAVVLARRRRSWRPLVIAGIAELSFALGVGAMKVFFARGVTYRRDPGFFEAGLFEHGTTGSASLGPRLRVGAHLRHRGSPIALQRCLPACGARAAVERRGGRDHLRGHVVPHRLALAHRPRRRSARRRAVPAPDHRRRCPPCTDGRTRPS